MKLLQLSPRQRAILRLHAEGKRLPDIAAELGVTLGTLAGHTQAIRRKMQVRSLKSALAIAQREGLL